MELNSVLARWHLHAAHDVIAPQQVLWLAIQGYLPVRIIFVIEQEDRRRGRFGLQNNMLRGVADEIHRAGRRAG